QPMMDNIGHAYTRGTAQAAAAGANPFSAKFQGGLAATGSAIHAASGAGAVIAAGVLVTAMRQALFAPDQLQKHMEDGDVGEYLLDLAMQRSGLNGTLDPLLQISTNLRYGADLNTLMEGASINWLAKNAQDVIS